MSLRVRTVVAGALVAALLLPNTAVAATQAQLKARLEELKAESASAGKAFTSAYWRLDETEVRLGKTTRRMRKTQKQLVAAKRRLGKRANTIYRRETLGTIEFLVGAQSFEQLVTRFDYLSRIGSADAKAIADVKALQGRLARDKERLTAERSQRTKDLRLLRSRRDKLQSRLRSKQAEFLRVKAQLDAARSGGAPRPSGVAAIPGPNGMVFPVAGSYYYSNTWGASRSGGRRRHKGTDIMSPNGTPCVAISDGTISSKSGGLGGRTIWLRGDNGWTFYYAHLSSWAVTSGRVRAGQIIGYVGSTGNATASAPHLHFEMHPGGGGAVNPYPYLRNME